jgi:hypothetical protein
MRLAEFIANDESISFSTFFKNQKLYKVVF